ncbi:MAG: LamG domain-containing protein, partial [Pseudomonadota bacterium]|nr:LamG domain-containing protein [Pseudomonadota bacterium]
EPHWSWDGGSSFPVTTGEWTHAVVTYDGSSQRVYKNGTLVYERSQSGAMGSNGNKLLVGARGSASPRHFFGGQIDELLIYSEALSGDKVSAIYTNQSTGKNHDGSDRSCPVCEFTAIGSYYLDECAWNGSSGEVVDASGNGHHGTAVNGVTTVNDGKVCRAGVFADNGYLALPGFPDLTSDFTMTAWIKTSDRTRPGQRIFADDESNSGGYALSLGDGGAGRLRFYSRDISPVSLDTQAVIDNDTWYFVAGVADITNHERHIYVFAADGTLIDHTSGSYSGTWGTDGGTVSIGGETNNSSETGNRFIGSLDEVQVFAGAIDESGLKMILHQTHGCSCIAPLADYHFDECYWDGSVGEVVDASGNGYDGTAVNGVTTVAEGQICRAGEFSSGSSQYVDLGSGFSPGSSSWSVSVWFKWDGSSGENIIYNKETLFEARVQGGYFQYAWEPHWSWDGGSSFPVTTGEWTHAVVTYDGSSQRVYKNGALVYERTQGGSIGSNGSKLLIGARGSNNPHNFFGGQIDELSIYAEALTDDQISDLYNNQRDGKNHDGSARTCPVCEFTAIGSYYLDECAWDGSSDEVVDSSGNGYDGTAVNGVTTVADGQVCRAGEFADNGYLALPEFPDLITDFTITAWIKTGDRAEHGQRVFADDEQNSHGYALSLGDGGAGLLRFYSRGISPVSLDTTVVIADDTWYFVAGVADITNQLRHIYVFDVSGSLVHHVSGIFTGTWGSDSGTASIGGETNNGETWNRFIGNLDEVQVFTGAIDESGLRVVLHQSHGCSCIAPLADYHFDECYWDGSASEVLDASGNAHDGTAKNGVTTVAAGQVCRSGEFDSGSSQYVDLGTGFSPGSSNWTVSVWFKWDGSGGENIIYNKETLFEARVQSGHFQYAWQPHWYWDGGSSFPVTAGEWTHAVVTYDGSSQRVYKNGVLLVYERAQSGAMGSNGNKLLVGARGSTSPRNFFGGQIDEVLIYSEALSGTQISDLYTNQQAGKNQDGSDRICSSCSSVDHFIITDEDDDQQALACRAELITIQAVDVNDNVISGYTGTVSLTADNGALWYDTLSSLVNDDPPQGSWTDNGHSSAGYSFVAVDNGQIKLWLRDSDIPAGQDSEVVRIEVVDGSATGALNLTYNKDGFLLVWDNPGNTVQLSGKPSDQGWNGQNIVLQAVQVNPTTGACESLLDGSISVQAKITYLDPPAGIEPLNLNGTEVDEDWTAVSLDFDQGEAPLVLQYDDAGQLQLEIRYDSDGDGVFDMSCVNNPVIIFRPLGFYIFTTTANGLADNGADSSVFVKAGTSFNLSAQAILWQQSDDTDNDGISDAAANLADNGVTPNYQAGGNPVSHSLVDPVGGSYGSLGSTSMNLVNGLGAVDDQTFSEVGIIALTVTDADYLGSGAAITGTSSNIGRFIPDHFDVQSSGVSLAPFCNNFTYLGQNFGYQDAPQITITARNSNNEETQNYRDDFFKLATTLTPVYGNNVSGRSLNVTPDDISLAAVSSQTITVTDTFSYLREVTPPFDADFDLTLAVADSDGVFYGSDGNFVIYTIGGIQLRSGRLLIYDNYGLETEDITHSPFNTQYWDGSWQVNEDDDCTSGIAFDSLRAHISSNPDVTDGVGYLMVDKPAGANPETITVCPVAPAWLSCSTSECCGTFTFGIYRGNDRLILKMEVPE